MDEQNKLFNNNDGEYREPIDFEKLESDMELRQEPEETLVLQTGAPVVTYVLLAINLIMWLAASYFESRGNALGTHVFLFDEKSNPLIMNGEYWRFITPIFLHADMIHLLVNSYSLYVLGMDVEKIFGSKRFLVIYLAAGIMGNIASFCFTTAPSVGASGAIFGLLGALLYLLRIGSKRFRQAYGPNILAMIAINVGYGFTHPRIDNFAHLGGLLGGFLIASAVGLAYKNDNMRNRIAAAVMAVVLSATGVAYGFTSDNNVKTKAGYESLEKAMERFKNGDYKESEELARKALEAGDRDKLVYINALNFLTSSLINQGKAREALEYAKEMVRLVPPTGHYQLGLCYIQLGDLKTAKTELEQAYKLDSGNAHAKQLLEEISKPSTMK